MMHDMKLRPEPFSSIRSGEKTFELRLFDEKRRKISVGDTVRFVNTDTAEVLVRRVCALHRFDSFAALYEALPLTKCGYTKENVKNASPLDMNMYYSAEEEAVYGVLAIELE